jgi:LysM repeat protein
MAGTAPSVKKPAIGIWLCLPGLLRIPLAMRWLRLFALLFLPLFTLLLPSCVSNSTGSNPGKHPSGIGPFDRNGNYVEAWADTPSQWGKKSSFSMASNSAADTDTPSVASTEEPPADAVPLPLSGSSTQTVVKTTAPVRKSSEVEVASLSRPKPKVVSRNVDDDDRPKSTVKKSTTTKGKQLVAKNSKSKPTAKELAAAKAKAKSKATASASAKSKPKSKATASTTTTKKKPATRYTVKKGDNLVKIADRYNTTAAAIKKANGLKNTVVSPGKTLVIPKG